MECWLNASRASTPCSSVSVCLCFPKVEAPLIWFGFGRVLVFEQASFGAYYLSQFRLPIVDVLPHACSNVCQLLSFRAASLCGEESCGLSTLTSVMYLWCLGGLV